MYRALCIFLAFAAAAAVQVPAAHATPERIIILRHGEKRDAYALCDIGIKRSLALKTRYLGKGAQESLFAGRSEPAAFFAITLHTLELASPAVATWAKPLIMYSVVPLPKDEDPDTLRALNQRAREAARDVMTAPPWRNKTVVMVWEHRHIANEKLQDQFAGQKVTLRQLLNLDTIDNVPLTWPGDNYDYFWIVDYARGSNRPTRFEMRKQSFPPPDQDIPSNDWDKPAGLTPSSGCVNWRDPLIARTLARRTSRAQVASQVATE